MLNAVIGTLWIQVSQCSIKPPFLFLSGPMLFKLLHFSLIIYLLPFFSLNPHLNPFLEICQIISSFISLGVCVTYGYDHMPNTNLNLAHVLVSFSDIPSLKVPTSVLIPLLNDYLSPVMSVLLKLHSYLLPPLMHIHPLLLCPPRHYYLKFLPRLQFLPLSPVLLFSSRPCQSPPLQHSHLVNSRPPCTHASLYPLC